MKEVDDRFGHRWTEMLQLIGNEYTLEKNICGVCVTEKKPLITLPEESRTAGWDDCGTKTSPCEWPS